MLFIIRHFVFVFPFLFFPGINGMFVPFLTIMPENQEQLNKVKLSLDSLPFYEGFVLNKETGSHLMAVTFSQSEINSKNRI